MHYEYLLSKTLLPRLNAARLENSKMAKSETFTPIDSMKKLYGFSVFYSGSRRVVRVFTLYEIGYIIPLYCIFPWSAVPPRKAITTPIANHFDYRYGGLYIDCPLEDNEMPIFVTIVEYQPSNIDAIDPILFRITYHGSTSTKLVKHSLCVPAIEDKESSDTNVFYEWILANFYLGVDRIYFYIAQPLPEKFNELFRSLERNPLKSDDRQLEIVLIQWKLPSKNVHRCAQTLSANECLLRAEKSSKYIRFHDLDEVLLELKPNIIEKELLSNSLSSSICYANRVMHLTRDLIQESKGYDRNLVIVKSTSACTTILTDYRTKCVVVAERVDMVAVHHIEHTCAVYSDYHVANFDNALIFHFRDFGFECDTTEIDSRLISALPKNFGEQIQSRMFNLSRYY